MDRKASLSLLVVLPSVVLFGLLSRNIYAQADLSVSADQQSPTSHVSGLVAYWKMEEGTGTTVIDSSGHGHNLYFANAPANPTWPTPTDVPTLIGGNSNSLAFDGVDDYAYAWPLAETVGSSRAWLLRHGHQLHL